MYNFILTLYYYAYRTASGRGGLRGARAGRPGTRRGPCAAVAPGGVAVRGAAARGQLHPRGRR